LKGGEAWSLLISSIRNTLPQHLSASPIVHICTYTIMLISIKTANDDSSFSDQLSDVGSVKSYVTDLGQKISQLVLSEQERKEILEAFQSTLLSSGQESKPAVESKVYENMFQDGEFENGYEEKLWRRWMGSELAEDRKEIAFEGHRTLLGLEPGAELRDKVVVQDLSDSAAKDDRGTGWSEYLQKLGCQKLQARFWR
jgi:hypothetical protein